MFPFFLQLMAEQLGNNWSVGDSPLILVVAHGVLFKELMIHLAEHKEVGMPCPGKEYRKTKRVTEKVSQEFGIQVGEQGQSKVRRTSTF